MTTVEFDEAFDELFTIAYRVAFRIIGRGAEAQEVGQEALARAFIHWQKVSRYSIPWVARVSTNLALDVVKKESKRRPPTSGVPATSTESAVINRIDVQRALARLSRRQRDVVSLLYLADLPATDVSLLLNCSVGTVKQHGSRALAALRQQILTDSKEHPHVRAS